MFEVPFSPIFSSGLGLTNSSLQKVGKVWSLKGLGAAGITAYPNLATGNLVVSDFKLKVDEANFPLEFYYTYNSKTAASGDAWQFSIPRFTKMPDPTQEGAGVAEFKTEDGHVVKYVRGANDAHFTAENFVDGARFMRFDARPEFKQWILHDPVTGYVEYYDLEGRLTKKTDAKGRVTDYVYEKGELKQIIGPSRIPYEFIRSENEIGKTITIYSKDLPLITYQFDKLNRLVTTTLASGYKITYTYANDKSELNNILQSDNTVIDFRFSDNKVQQLDIGAGSSHEPIYFFYQVDGDPNKSSVKDSLGFTTIFKCDDNGDLKQIDRVAEHDKREGVVDTTKISYNALKQVTDITSPDGGNEHREYDPLYANLIKMKVRPNGQVTQYNYNKNAETIYRVAIVDYLDEETPLVTRFVYECKNDQGINITPLLRFKISPEGRVTEYRYDGKGNIETERKYLNYRYNVTKTNPNDIPTPEYLSENLSKEDPKAVALKQYIYDCYGHVEKIKTFAAIDGEGRGIQNNEMGDESAVFDFFGNVTKSEEKVSQEDVIVECQSYDDLRRLKSKSDGLKNTTNNDYLDKSSQIKTTQPNGRVDTDTLDQRGLVMTTKSQVADNARVQVNTRNQVGSVVMSQLQNGIILYSFYDAQHRIAYRLTSEGRLIEYIYDNNYNFNLTISHALKIDVEQLFLKPWKLPDREKLVAYIAAHTEKQAENRRTYVFTNKSNRKEYEIEEKEEGVYSIRQYIYDKLDREVAKIFYADTITQQQLDSLKKGITLKLTPDFKKDRCTRTFYDNDNFVIATQNAEGYVTKYTRNGAGWVTKSITYSKLPTYDYSEGFTLINTDEVEEDGFVVMGQLKPVASRPCQPIDISITNFKKVILEETPLKDIVTYSFNNQRGLCTLEVDAEGFITTKSYYAHGLIKTLHRYDTKVDEAWFLDTTKPPTLPVESENDEIKEYTYDALKRPATITYNTHKVDVFGYDKMQHEIFKKTCDTLQPNTINGDTYRATEKQYNEWEQITAEANEFVAELIEKIDKDDTLSSVQKDAKKADIWQTYSKRYTYDNSGIKIKTSVRISKEHSQDQVTYHYYDQDRQPILDITVLDDKNVFITEWEPNSFNEVEKTRKYSQETKKLSPQLIATLTGGILLPTSELRVALNAIQDKADLVTESKYGKFGLPVSETDEYKRVTEKSYNAFRECNLEKLPVKDKAPSLTIKREFNCLGRETVTSRSAGDLVSTVTRKYEHPLGVQTSTTDAENATTTTPRDRLGVVTGVIDNDGKVKQSFVNNAFGQAKTETDGLGVTTTHVYTRSKREHKIIPPISGTGLTITSNVFAETISESNALLHTKTTTHAPDGQVSRRLNELKSGSENAFNLLGQSAGKNQIAAGAIKVKNKVFHTLGGDINSVRLDIEGLNLETKYKQDLLHRNTAVIDPLNNEAKFKYGVDEQRVSSSLTVKVATDIKQESTSVIDASQQIVGMTTVDDQYKTTSNEQVIHDDLSIKTETVTDPVSSDNPNGLNLKETAVTNKNGKIILEKDAKGNAVRTVYDSSGNKRYQINARGGVTEWTYHENDPVATLRVYASVISNDILNKLQDTVSLSDIQSWVSPSKMDTLTKYFYDDNKRERFSVDYVYNYKSGKYEGIVSERNYYSSNREAKRTLYANVMILADNDLLSTTSLIEWAKSNTSDKDRFTYNILDAAGRKRFVIDPEGVITEQTFDHQNNVIRKTVYAKRVTADEAKSLADLTDEEVSREVKTDARDRTNIIFYNTSSKPKPIFEINAEGRIKRNTWADNCLMEECEFKQPIDIGNLSDDELLAQLQSLVADKNVDRVTTYAYNNANFLIKKTDALGNSDTYIRDSMNRVRRHIDRENNEWIYDYDAAGRLSVEKAPEVSIVTKIGSDETANVAVEKRTLHDAAGNIECIIDAANTPQALLHLARFDACNQPFSTSIESTAENGPTQAVSEFIRNGKNQIVAERKNDGQWLYYVLDNKGRVRYEIDAEGAVTRKTYNTADETVEEVKYALPIAIDLKSFTDGIPLELIENGQVLKESPCDQITVMDRTKQGDVVSIESYLRQEGESKAREKIEYNAFREWISKKHVDKATGSVAAEEFRWLNKLGTVIADYLLENVDGKPNTQQLRRYRRNVFNQVQKLEKWANAPTVNLSSDLLVDDLDKSFSASKADEIVSYVYNLLGQCQSETSENISLYELATETNGNKLTYIKNTPQVSSHNKQYFYNKTQKKVKTLMGEDCIDEYYNARGDKIAELGVARLVAKDDGTEVMERPLTLFIPNAHGKTSVTIKCAQGVTSTEAGVLPTVAEDPERDCVLFNLMDELNRDVATVVDPKTAKQPEGEGIITARKLDECSRVREEIDPEGNVSRSYYNGNGYKQFTVSASGSVTEYEYKTRQLVTLKRMYEHAIDLSDKSKVLTINDIKALTDKNKDNINDSIVAEIYGAYNKPTYTVTKHWNADKNCFEGLVVEHVYNAALFEVKTIKYTVPIEWDFTNRLTVFDVKSKISARPTKDAVTYYIVDKAGRNRFTFSPEGAVVERQFDEANHELVKIAYATQIDNPECYTSLAPDKVSIPKDKLQRDRFTQQLFNSYGKVEYKFKPIGSNPNNCRVLRYVYDVKGRLIAKVKYANPMKRHYTEAELREKVQLLKFDTEKDRLTQYQYNPANQRSMIIDPMQKSPDGTMVIADKFLRDIFGNATTKIDRLNNSWKNQFNRAGRHVKETSPSIEVTEVKQNSDGELSVAETSGIKEVENTYEHYPSGLLKVTTAAANTESKRSVETVRDENQQLIATNMQNVPIDNAEDKPDTSSRPENLVSLTMRTIYNNRKLKVAESDEFDPADKKATPHWTFTVYDDSGLSLYIVKPNKSVKKLIRNTLGYVEKEIEFDEPLNFDPADYTKPGNKQGIPRNLLEEFSSKQITNVKNKTKEYTLDRCGRVLEEAATKIFYAIPDPDGGLPKMGYASPTKRNFWNTFDECYYEESSIGEESKSSLKQWYDLAGNRVITVDGISRPKRFYYNIFKQETGSILYAEAPIEPISMLSSNTEIYEKLRAVISKKHRINFKKFYRSGMIFRDTTYNAFVHRIEVDPVTNKVTMIGEYRNISKEYEYSATRHLHKVTNENRSCEYFYQNARGDDIGYLGIAFTSEDGQVIIPLMHFGVNAHGERVATKRFATGAKEVNPNALPQPIALDPLNDQVELRLTDVRGLEKVYQDARQNVQQRTHTSSRKEALSWKNSTNYDLANNLNDITYRDLSRHHFDPNSDQVNKYELIRTHLDESTVEDSQEIFSDSQGMTVAEGAGFGKKPLYYDRDLAGRVWRTNAYGGADTLVLRDLQGNVTMYLQSATLDLRDDNVVTYATLSEFITKYHSNIDALDSTAFVLDDAGRLWKNLLPRGHRLDKDATISNPLPLQMSLRLNDEALPSAAVLTWPKPDLSNMVAKFKYWPKGTDPKIKGLSLDIQLMPDEHYLGVDVSKLNIDQYDYEVSYAPPGVDPETNKSFYTHGSFQVFSGNSENSQQLVIMVKPDGVVLLLGNLANIDRMELWCDGMRINQNVNIHIDSNNNQRSVDLSSYPTGTYQLKPLRVGGSDVISQPFSLHTMIEPTTPSVKEFSFASSLTLVNDQASLSWNLPDEYKNLSLEIKCQYSVKEGLKHKILDKTFIVNPCETVAPDFNLLFGEQVHQLLHIRIAMINPTNNGDEEKWVLLNEQLNDEPDDPNNDDPNKDEPCDHCLNPASRNCADFGARRIALVKNVEIKADETVETIAAQDSTLNLLDVSKGRYADQLKIPVLSKTSQGMLVDTTGLLYGAYPVTNAKTPAVIRVTGLSDIAVYPSEDQQQLGSDNAKTIPQGVKVQSPTIIFDLDFFDNKVVTTDQFGEKTNKEFNHRSQTISIELPAAPLVTSKGKSIDEGMVRPKSYFGFNESGAAIGTTNANGNTEGILRDEAGHNIGTILGDGTRIYHKMWNALDQLRKQKDARGFEWSYEYDCNNNLVAINLPEDADGQKNRIEYGYDESNSRRIEIDAAKKTTRYNESAKGEITARIDSENRITRYGITFDHDTGLYTLTETLPTGQSRRTVMDYFKALKSMFDLQGNETKYIRDRKQQPIEIVGTRLSDATYSVARSFKLYYDYVSKSLRSRDVFFPEEHPPQRQRMQLIWSGGQMIAKVDVTNNQSEFITVDLAGRPVASELWKNGMLLRHVTSRLNALGWEVCAQDRYMTLVSKYDPVGNVRYKSGEINLSDGMQHVDSVIAVFDEVERVISEGDKELTYKNGYRDTEKDGNGPVKKLNYKPSGEFKGYDAESNGDYLHRSLNVVGEVTDIDMQGDGQHVTQHNIPSHPSHVGKPPDDDPLVDRIPPVSEPVNSIHWDEKSTRQVTTKDDHKNDKVSTTVTYSSRYWNGALNEQQIYYDDNAEEQLKFLYADYDFSKLVAVEMTQWAARRQPGKESKFGVTSNIYRDSNGSLNAIFQAGFDLGPITQELREHVAPVLLYDVTNSGDAYGSWAMLCDRYPKKNVILTSDILIHNSYFTNIHGQYIASYCISNTPGSKDKKSAKLNLGLRGNGVRDGRGVNYSSANVASSLETPDISSQRFQRKLTVGRAIEAVSESYPPMKPIRMVVSGNVTIDDVAKSYGDPASAGMIAAANGVPEGATLQPGREIIIPGRIEDRKNVNTSVEYQKFQTIIMGNVTPQMVALFPKEDSNSMEMLVTIVAVGLACIVAPHLAPVLLEIAGSTAAAATAAVATGSVSGIVASGVAAGLVDAAVQGAAVGAGLQSEFSLQQLAATMVGSSVTAAFGTATTDVAANTASKSVSRTLLETTTRAVAQQVSNIATGAQPKFNVSEIFVTVSAAFVGAKLSSYAPDQVSSGLVQTSTNIAAEAIHHHNADALSVVAQLTGSVILSGADALANHYLPPVPTLDSRVPENKVPTSSDPKTRPMTAKDQAFIKEMESKAQTEISSPEFTPDTEAFRKVMNSSRLERWNAEARPSVATKAAPTQAQSQASGNSRIHDLTDSTMTLLSQATKGTLLGEAIGQVRDLRANMRAIAYGNSEERMEGVEYFGKQVAVGVGMAATGGILGEAAAVLMPAVRELGLFAGRGVAEGSAVSDATLDFNRPYGVAFFGKDNLEKFYSSEKISIGSSSGEPFFFMPLDDSSVVRSAHDAARFTGMAPSANKAYIENSNIYGISFPTEGMKVRMPSAADARGWPHFFEGGRTAIRLEGGNPGYMINSTREFVTPGGTPAMPGTVIFQVGEKGEWIPYRRF